MKKIMRFVAFTALLAVLGVACNKEQANEDPRPVVPEEKVPEETVEYDPVKYLTGFGADMEATKADLDDVSGSLSWTDGDQVKIIRSDGETALYTYNESENKFVPAADPLEKNGSPMHAFFPAGNFVWDTDHVQFTMPAAFESLTGIMNPMAAVIPADATAETNITLKNLGGIYEVRLSTSKALGETVTKVQLGNSSVNITGSAPVSFDGEGTPSIGALDGGNMFATLEFASPIQLTSTPKSVYFFLPVTATDGFTDMTVKAVFGKTVNAVTYEPYEGKTRKSAMTVTRSMRKHMNFDVQGFFSGGDGLTEATAYQIATAEDFKAIKTLMESDAPTAGGVTGEGTFFSSTGVYYKQTADIDFGNEALPSIGIYNATLADATPFQGTYDGNNKKLEKFTVSGDVAASVGLFTYVNNATLKNIKVVNASVTGTNVTGILTGRCIGTTIIEGCSLDGGQVTGRNSVGFIAHIHGNAKVKGCSVNNITVVTAAKGSDANNQGGVVGYAGGNSSIESCNTYGTIQFTGANSGSARGGIVGKLDSTGSVEECTNGAAVTNTLTNNTGGIAGALVNGSISGCVNAGNVTGTAYVGGIVGDASSTAVICFIESCRTNATVSGTANCVGGIVGRALNGVVVNSCYAKGSVSGRYDVGGLIGLMQVNNAGSGTLCRAYMYDCLANMDVTSTRDNEGDCRTGGAVGTVQISQNQFVAIDNCGVLGVTLTASYAKVGGFVGWTNNSKTAERLAIRNCYTMVGSVPGSANYGGFVGYAQGKGELRFDYYVAEDTNSNIESGVTKDNLSKTTASVIGSAATCAIFNSNNTYQLEVNGKTYKSSLGWAIPDGVDYPVPGALIALGEEYYK